MRVANDVLAVLSACTTAGSLLTLPGQLDRAMYLRVNEVLEAAGGKWQRKAKAHLFPTDAGDVMDQVIVAGEVAKPQDFGCFYTPPAVVARLVQLADLGPGSWLLEPSAGRGAIASAFHPTAYVECVELLPANAAYLRSLDFESVNEADFLTVPPVRVFDRVAMNPPFAKQADIHHVNHALRFVRPGGRLVAVMAAGVSFRSNSLTVSFREMVAERGGLFEDVPTGAFKESGTMVNTVIVSIPC
jgi:predicted RNA methylase